MSEPDQELAALHTERLKWDADHVLFILFQDDSSVTFCAFNYALFTISRQRVGAALDYLVGQRRIVWAPSDVGGMVWLIDATKPQAN